MSVFHDHDRFTYLLVNAHNITETFCLAVLLIYILIHLTFFCDTIFSRSTCLLERSILIFIYWSFFLVCSYIYFIFLDINFIPSTVFSLRLSVYRIIFVGGLRKYGIPVIDLLLFLVFANKQDLPGALSMEEIREVHTVRTYMPELWIRIGFNADPDPAFFYLNADPDSVSQTNVDPSQNPDPSQTLPSVKV
jgi:hypothetical protein